MQVTGASDGTVETTPPGGYGIYKSTDSGQSWSRVLWQPGVKGTELRMDPGNPQTLYAGLQSAGFYKSTDGGANWTPINTGIDASLLTGGQYAADWAEIAIAPSTTSTLYAALAQCPSGFTATGNWWCQPAIYKSTDSGQSWTQQRAFVQSPPDLDLAPSTYSTYGHKLIVHPTDATKLWFTGMMLGYSDNSGVDWNEMGSNTAAALHPDHHDLYVFVDGSNLLGFDANDGGFFVGDLNADVWDDQPQYGLQITQLQSIATVPGAPGGLLIGTQDNGADWLNGATWQLSDLGDAASTFADADDPTTTYDVVGKWGEDSTKVTPVGVCHSGLQCRGWPEPDVSTRGLSKTEPVSWYPPMVQGGVVPPVSAHPLLLGGNLLHISTDQATLVRPSSDTGRPHFA